MFSLREVNQMEREMCRYLERECRCENENANAFAFALRTPRPSQQGLETQDSSIPVTPTLAMENAFKNALG
jgi:hypothetical protein